MKNVAVAILKVDAQTFFTGETAAVLSSRCSEHVIEAERL